MKTRSYLQFRRAQAAHLAARLQQRPWKDAEDEPEQATGQPQSAKVDFSHVDLFAHAPQRDPIQSQISALPQIQAQTQAQTQAQKSGSIALIQRFPNPGSSAGPADVVAQSAFNPMDILHKLLIAIDQSDAYMAGGTMYQPVLKRKVDFATVVRVLSNLTVAESQAVQAAYFEHEHRTLKQDLFGKGESGVESNLNESQQAQIRALLAGTRAEGGAAEAEQQAATIHVGSAQAAEMQRLLHGDRDKADVDRIMAILRQSPAANAALDAAYKRLTGTSLEIGRLKPIDAIRASMLLVGSVAAADTFDVSLLKGRIASIDAELSQELAASQELSLANVVGSLGGGNVVRQVKIQQLRKQRQKLAEEIAQRGEQIATEAESKGESVKARVGAVFGDVEGLTQQVKGPQSVLIRAIAQDDPVAKVAAQLRKDKEADKLSAAKLAAAMRGLRAEAEERARRMLPPGDPGVESKAASLADEYFGRLRTEYNALVPKGGDSFDEIVNETGNKGDETLNQTLWVNAGRLGDVEELVLALNGDRKDTETVERVLRNKSEIEIQNLKVQYLGRTGKSLDLDLFGQAPTTAGEDNPQLVGGYFLKSQGKAKGTSRLNLEDYMQRPNVEGGLEEMLYTVARAEREHEFTVENRGVTGWWRDTWGNEQRALLDETLAEMHQLKDTYLNLVGWMPVTNTVLRPEAAKSGAAKAILQKLRLARHTIRGDRAAYEKATAELRETFTAIASFVIQAALTALLTPAAGALFKGAMAARGVMAARMIKWVETLAVNAASGVGGNLMVQGSDYSLTMLKADLLGAIGGQLGSDTIEKLLGPVAKGLAARLGDKCSAEITAFAKTVGNVEGGALAQGNEGDLSLQNLVKTHLMGKGSEVITKGVSSAAGLEPTAPTPGTGSKESGLSETAAHGPASSQSESSQPSPAETKSVSESVSKPAAPEPENATSLKSPGAGSPDKTMGSGPPAGSVLQARDPHDLPAAFKLYKQLIAADPRREVSLLYNHATDQWAIVQGGPTSVNVHQAMQDKGWEVHETTSARHNHPVGVDNQTSEYNQFPSGRGGDLSHIEAGAAGSGESQWHAIDITTAAGPDRTWVMRTKEGLWTVDYPDLAERGGRGRVSFASLEQYQNWFQNRFGFSPDRAGSPALSAVVPPNQPTHTGSHLDQLAQDVQVPVLTGLSLGTTQLKSGGDAGSLSAHGSEFGALPTTLVDGTPIVVKVYPRTPHMEIPFTHEVRGLAAAEALGGPKLYGLVYIDDTKFAVAMEQIPGGFPTTFSTAPADIAEAAKHGANVHAGTVQDVETYGQRLWNAGYYSLGDVQGFVDDVGHWRPIDLQAVRKRTGAADELLTHQDSINGLVNELQEVISQRQGP